MIQLHMCVIYFWAGVSKLKGDSWYTGEAMWQVMANQEYQTLDLTWLAHMPWVPYLVSHVTVLWEIMFCVLVWVPKLRPLMLLMGAFMHFGIGAFLGMWTFGLIMTYAYFAFSDADVWRARLSWVLGAERFATAPDTATEAGFDLETERAFSGESTVPRTPLEPDAFSPTASALAASLPPAASRTSLSATTQESSTGTTSTGVTASSMTTLAAASSSILSRDASQVSEQLAADQQPAADQQLASYQPPRINLAAVPPSAGSVADFSPDRDLAARTPLAARPQGDFSDAVEMFPRPTINAPVILNQKADNSPADAEEAEAAYLNPESALLLISLNEAERTTLRRYFRDQDILCRAATTTRNGLTLAAKIKPAAMVIAGTQLSPDNLLTLLEDLEDMADVPTLVLASRMQAQYLQDMGMSSLRMLVYPMSPAKIRRELMRMLFAPTAPPVYAHPAAQAAAAQQQAPPPPPSPPENSPVADQQATTS